MKPPTNKGGSKGGMLTRQMRAKQSAQDEPAADFGQGMMAARSAPQQQAVTMGPTSYGGYTAPTEPKRRKLTLGGTVTSV